MPSLDQQLTACAIKYLGGGSQGRLSADGIRRKAMIQYLGGAAALGRLTTEALAAKCARQFTGQTFSGMSLNGLLLRWAYGVAGVGTPGRLSLEGVAMRAANQYLTALPPTKTYADFQAHIATLATNGVSSWPGTVSPGDTPAGSWRATAAPFSGAMYGTTWQDGCDYTGGTNVNRAILHALPSEAVALDQAGAGREIYFVMAQVSDGNLVALNRNGYLSLDHGGTFAKIAITDLIYWDGTQAQRMNPSTGTGPTPYPIP